MDKPEFNLRLIKTYVSPYKVPTFIGEDFNVFTYELEMNFITIDWRSFSMTIVNSGEEIYFTFDGLGKIHGIKCINDATNRSILIERYNHGIPHGEWSYDRPFNYWKKNYINGVLNGPFTICDQKLKIKGTYKKGVYDDSLEYFDMSSGTPKPLKSEWYKDGRLTNTIDYEAQFKAKEASSVTVPLKVIGRDKALFWKF